MSLNKNKTSYNYIFGGRLDVYGKLTVASDTTINGKLTVANNTTITRDLKVDSKLDVEGRAFFNENVGIGTDNPMVPGKLDVLQDNSRFLVREDPNQDNHLCIDSVVTDNSAFDIMRIRASEIRLQNANITNLIMTTNNRIGIGSDIPQRTLDVVGSIRKTEYEPGEIIETLVGVCDGNPVTVKSGTYTLSNVNATQAAGDSYATVSGSSINYVPPAGTTRVCYEFWVYMRDAGSGSGSRPLLHFQSELDNSSGTPTIINNSRHTWRFISGADVQDVQTWIYNKVIVSIGQVGTESVANGRLVSWDSARTFRWRFRRYSSSYDADLHQTQHWDGTGTNIRVRPHVKITAIA